MANKRIKENESFERRHYIVSNTIRMNREGMTSKEIANELGVTIKSINEILKILKFADKATK